MDYRLLGPSEILRCEKRCLIDAGFTETWDDGFKQGDAYLFLGKRAACYRDPAILKRWYPGHTA
ncbi:protein of unknown function (plasmid) [Caballeronia sp. S22]